jgi:hypothetical protein
METHRQIKNKNLDPFEVMKSELKVLNAKGIRPVIIIDELQALESVYFNSQRELIKETLYFFVAMTKVKAPLSRPPGRFRRVFHRKTVHDETSGLISNIITGSSKDQQNSICT